MEHDVDIEVSARVKKLMLTHGMRNRHLAAILGIHMSAVGKCANGIRSWKSSEIKQIAELFGVSADYLLGITNEEPQHYKTSA